MLRNKLNLAVYLWLLMGLIMLICTNCVATESNSLESEDTISSSDAVPTIIMTTIAPSVTHTATNTSTPTPISMNTSTPTQIATKTQEAIDTLVPTSTLIAIETLEPILTPLPTILPEGRGQVYNELMSTNKGCMLPCWWGFELGETTIQQVEQFYSSFDASTTVRAFSNGRSRLTALFVDPQIEDGIQIRHMFRAQDNIVIEAEIQVIYSANHQIESFLQQFKQPSEVWLRTIPEPFEGVLPVSLRLYFPNQGILVSYAVFGELVNDNVQVCFNDTGGTIYLLWDPAIWNPNGDKGFIERTNESSELTLEGHRPIDEISNWDIEQFYTILSDPNHTECLQTPSEFWSSP
ncbi:MAG: hypothetical protein KDE51_05860 [Anaerolineales bacterium]|nr:hypothetical protein [Anaerolineales bacterium]